MVLVSQIRALVQHAMYESRIGRRISGHKNHRVKLKHREEATAETWPRFGCCCCGFDAAALQLDAIKLCFYSFQIFGTRQISHWHFFLSLSLFLYLYRFYLLLISFLRVVAVRILVYISLRNVAQLRTKLKQKIERERAHSLTKHTIEQMLHKPKLAKIALRWRTKCTWAATVKSLTPTVLA